MITASIRWGRDPSLPTGWRISVHPHQLSLRAPSNCHRHRRSVPPVARPPATGHRTAQPRVDHHPRTAGQSFDRISGKIQASGHAYARGSGRRPGSRHYHWTLDPDTDGVMSKACIQILRPNVRLPRPTGSPQMPRIGNPRMIRNRSPGIPLPGPQTPLNRSCRNLRRATSRARPIAQPRAQPSHLLSLYPRHEVLAEIAAWTPKPGHRASRRTRGC